MIAAVVLVIVTAVAGVCVVVEVMVGILVVAIMMVIATKKKEDRIPKRDNVLLN